MCMPYLIEIKPTHRKSRAHRTAGPSPRLECSPPPCLITIEPRSPKAKQRDCSPRVGGLHIHGEASLRGKREQCDISQSQPEQQSSPRSHHPSPRSPPPKPSTCEGRKSSRRSSSSSSSSSSASSKSGFREIQSKIENLIKRLAGLEKELQADRERTNQATSAAVERDNKIEKEVGGLKATVGCIDKEVQALRKDVAWVKEQQGRNWEQAQRYWDGSGRDGRVRVEWERGVPKHSRTTESLFDRDRGVYGGEPYPRRRPRLTKTPPRSHHPETITYVSKTIITVRTSEFTVYASDVHVAAVCVADVHFASVCAADFYVAAVYIADFWG
ncbi:MAG: hypothetical protein Q9178_007382 [Gyalolechia marmorata]